ncbi:hypothetical protein HZ326_10129 [Fusarium oxysporum f. sp. albedinis]|nr:hypothetical protein HZ326_10129 [Fusarium oxysporum f. sp. albedinis]
MECPPSLPYTHSNSQETDYPEAGKALVSESQLCPAVLGYQMSFRHSEPAPQSSPLFNASCPGQLQRRR